MQAAAPSSSQPPQQPSSQTWTRSARFSFLDGNLWLRTSDTLYHVHRYLFMRHSSMFNELVIASACLYSDGSRSSNPIILREVDTRDFDEFLSMLYPSDYQSHSPKTVEQWTAVLSLSSRWYFDSIRQLAIDNLTQLVTAVDKIVLARQFDIREWLVEGYTTLCYRPTPPDLEEGGKLGMGDVIKIVNMRHHIASSPEKVSAENLLEAFVQSTRTLELTKSI